MALTDGKKLGNLGKVLLLFLFLLVLAFLASCSTAAPSSDDCEHGQVSRVVDGDTLVVQIDGGGEEKVRLIGIDCPESVSSDESKNCEEGREASAFTKAAVPAGTQVWLERDVSDTDRYGRLLRYVWLEKPDGVDRSSMLNAVIVAAGYAKAADYEPDTSCSALFHSLEREAAAESRGVSYLWA